MAGERVAMGRTQWQYLIIGALVIAAGVLGYLYYQEQADRDINLKIEVPRTSN
jgi:hypothetical protein